MAEIPKHLLERAAARRAALSGGGDAPAPAAASETAPAAPAASSPAVVASAAPAPAAAPAKSAPVVQKAPAPPRGSVAAKFATVFFLTVTPIWAFFMWGAFGTPRASANSPAALGESLYNANCAKCHNANGSGSQAGGVGRPLWQGEAEKTFPNPVDQAAFIKHGSCEIGTPYGAKDREGGQHQGKGGMPAFKDLPEEDLLYIVAYERHVLNKQKFPVNMFAKAGEDATVPAKEPIDAKLYFEENPLSKVPICG